MTAVTVFIYSNYVVKYKAFERTTLLSCIHEYVTNTLSRLCSARINNHRRFTKRNISGCFTITVLTSIKLMSLAVYLFTCDRRQSTTLWGPLKWRDPKSHTRSADSSGVLGKGMFPYPLANGSAEAPEVLPVGSGAKPQQPGYLECIYRLTTKPLLVSILLVLNLFCEVFTGF